ncbi:leucine-rich repeat protein [Flavobacterium sp.]|uniref:leucine-rich repeat domain-containing protein n=1 Tax=Flavobacterium sp. TaxID=239 RepID=UPI002C1E4AA1|nr:leucine-rich repeat protein [Flavobacterium sp.]HSD08233.1 leucine-rich repeat protein [Flavobacterium sp.]
MIKKLLLLFAFVNMSIASAKTFVPPTFLFEGINYEVTAPGTVKVVSNTEAKYSGSVVIPSMVTYNDVIYNVTEIGESAFFGCESLDSITIPNSVVSIGEYTFYNCSSLASITIPSSVTSIGEYTFYNCSNLTSVTIPSSVTSIGDDAFYNCSNLTSVTIPSSVTSIGNDAFSRCYSLTSVTIPNSVTFIGDNAFAKCSNLTSLTIPDSVASIGYGSFANCSKLTYVTIPNSVTSIGARAFNTCYNLKQITCNIENPLYIDSSVFGGVDLEFCRLIVPTGQTQAYKDADVWNEFTTLTDVAPFVVNGLAYVITSAVEPTTVKIVANIENSNPSSITIPATVSNNGVVYNVTEISPSAFREYWNLKQITCNIEEPLILDEFVFDYVDLASCKLIVSTGKIQAYREAPVWEGFSSIVDVAPFVVNGVAYEITSASTVKVIANYEDNNIRSITIPTTVNNNGVVYDVTEISDSAFNGYSNLSQITCDFEEPLPIDESVLDNVNLDFCRLIVPAGKVQVYRDTYVWKYFTTITDVAPFIVDGIAYEITSAVEPTTVKVISNPENSYSGSITIPSTVSNMGIVYNVTEISSYAFQYNADITSVSIGDNVTSLQDGTFQNCYRLTSANIGNKVASIGWRAFSECYSLKTINIPASVLSIGQEAFALCSSLTKIEIPNTVTSIEALAFGRSGLTTFTFPSSVTKIELGTFWGCNELASVTIPSSVTAIDEMAFTDCSKLKTVNCAIESPLDINSNVFDNTTVQSCALVVPAASLDSYKAAAVWENFYSITASTTLGTVDFSAKNKVSVYPNPVHGELFVQLNTTDKTTIQLFDVTGKVVIQKTVNATENSIDTSNLVNGLYFVKVNSNEGTFTKKVIKN